MRRLVDKGIMRVAFSPWSELWFAAFLTVLLIGVFELGLGDRTFWIWMAVLVGPFLIFEVVMVALFARRGESYFEFKRELGDRTLAELDRKRQVNPGG